MRTPATCHALFSLFSYIQNRCNYHQCNYQYYNKICHYAFTLFSCFLIIYNIIAVIATTTIVLSLLSEQLLCPVIISDYFGCFPIYAAIPPSTYKICPLTKSDASDARNTVGPIKSSGFPHLPAGVFDTMN